MIDDFCNMCFQWHSHDLLHKKCSICSKLSPPFAVEHFTDVELHVPPRWQLLLEDNLVCDSCFHLDILSQVYRILDKDELASESRLHLIKKILF